MHFPIFLKLNGSIYNFLKTPAWNWSGSCLFCYGAWAQKESAKLQNMGACTDKTGLSSVKLVWLIQKAGWSADQRNLKMSPESLPLSRLISERSKRLRWQGRYREPRILCAKHGSPITGKSFIVSFRFVEYHKHWIKTEVLFLFMFRIEVLFIFSFITCDSRILQRVKFKNFCCFAVCSMLFFFHNLCPEYSWIPLGLV